MVPRTIGSALVAASVSIEGRLMANRLATFKQADIRRNVAAAQVAGILACPQITADGRAAPLGDKPAEMGEFDEAAE
jgi:hypothetical protein